MTEYEVTCATKRQPHEYITMIGGPVWGRKTPEQAITAIRNGDKFFVRDRQNRVYIRIVSMSGGYVLRTEPNGLPSDNLENLSACN